MNLILDQTQDLAGVETYRLEQFAPAPEFVKAASQNVEISSLPNHVFADDLNRLYPMHTAADTWRSYRFALDKAAAHDQRRLPWIMSRLEAHGKYFGITKDLADLREKFAKRDVEVEVPDAHFGLVWTDANDVKTREYPLRNATEVKAAAEWLTKYANDFVYADRRTISRKILSRAAELGVDVGDGADVLTKIAGFGRCFPERAAIALQDRAYRVRERNNEAADELLKMAAAMEKLPLVSVAAAEKLAVELDELDRAAGLVSQYDEGFQPPEFTLFEVTAKMAREHAADLISTTTGRTYSQAKIATKLTRDEVQEWMGEEFAKEVTFGYDQLDLSKLARVVPTLPRNDATVFDRMLTSLGVEPVMQESEKAASVFTPSVMQELAALHG